MEVSRKSVKRLFIGTIALIVPISALIVGLGMRDVYATTFSVVNTNDSGAGSLRQAILDANADASATSASPHRIEFAIPGSGLQTINLASNLPGISRAVVVDGTTQDDAQCGTLVPQLPFASGSNTPHKLNIQINAANAVGDVNTLYFGAGSSGSTVRGLIVNGAKAPSNPGIFGNNIGVASAGITVECNYIGVDETGTVNVPNEGFAVSTIGANGIVVRNNLVVRSINVHHASDAVIEGNIQNIKVDGSDVIAGSSQGMGGFDQANRITIKKNLVSNGGISTGSNAMGPNLVDGNFVGVASSGDVGLGSGTAFSGAITVGNGSTLTTVSDNVAASIGYGISVDSADETSIFGNKIGASSSGGAGTNLSLPDDGIRVDNSTNTVVGGVSPDKRNIVVGSEGTSGGVAVLNSSDVVIEGNHVGVLADGVSVKANVKGVNISGSNNVRVGGTTSSERNLISGNTEAGVSLSGGNDQVRVVGNYIGTDMSGAASLPNEQGVASYQGGSNIAIGGPVFHLPDLSG